MTDHPSSLQLERFSVDDLPADAQKKTHAHVQDCPECRHALDELEQARRDCLRELPAEKLLARMAPRPRPRRPLWSWIGFGAVTAAAAGLAVVLFFPGAQPIHLKGMGVSVYCRRGDQVRLLAADERIRAGDGLRVVLTLTRQQPAAAWFLDARGRVDRFLTDGSTALDPGEHALPGAIVESPCVDHWLVVLTGSGAAQRLAAAFEHARADGLPPGEAWAPAGAVIRPLRCE
jgi:ferric-dicitrate binding protein FerR (iron transport regulator)